MVMVRTGGVGVGVVMMGVTGAGGSLLSLVVIAATGDCPGEAGAVVVVVIAAGLLALLFLPLRRKRAEKLLCSMAVGRHTSAGRRRKRHCGGTTRFLGPANVLPPDRGVVDSWVQTGV